MTECSSARTRLDLASFLISIVAILVTVGLTIWQVKTTRGVEAERSRLEQKIDAEFNRRALEVSLDQTHSQRRETLFVEIVKQTGIDWETNKGNEELQKDKGAPGTFDAGFRVAWLIAEEVFRHGDPDLKRISIRLLGPYHLYPAYKPVEVANTLRQTGYSSEIVSAWLDFIDPINARMAKETPKLAGWRAGFEEELAD